MDIRDIDFLKALTKSFVKTLRGVRSPQWFIDRNHKGQTGMVSLHWSFEMGSFMVI